MATSIKKGQHLFFCGLSGDDESVWELLHPERKYCASCKWYALEDGV